MPVVLPELSPGDAPPEFAVGNANANCPPDFQKYSSELTKTPFQMINSFFF